MIIIPAIDLKAGKCVRLRQGRMELSTVFNDNPVDQAKTWENLGAKRIHIVDLDGSMDGQPINLSIIRDIFKNTNVPLELGGGVRDENTAQMYLDIGVNILSWELRLGKPNLALELLRKFPGKVAIGVDAQAGKVAVQGWTESTDHEARELALVFDSDSLTAFIYTDIERDGMMVGPNFTATGEFAAAVNSQVIFSGGVTNIHDVKKALALEKDGVTGIIIGRALYEGAVDLEEAISLTESLDVS